MILQQRIIKFRVWLPSMHFMGEPFYPFEPNDGGTFRDDAIFMQFTSLILNGIEVYEGDIIKYTLENGEIEYGVVRFSKHGYWTSQAEDYQEEILSEELEAKCLKCEIAGNIYQHANLIQ